MDATEQLPLSGVVAMDVGAVARLVSTLRGEGVTRARRLLVLARGR